MELGKRRKLRLMVFTLLFSFTIFSGAHGGDWTSIPPGLGTNFSLNAVWGSSGSDVFAVGTNGTILHYVGNEWVAMTSGTTQPLYAIWGTSGADIFAVGRGTILHYDGSAWSAMTAGTAWDINSVWGSSGSDVFAVGDNKILHYDGNDRKVWTEMASVGVSLKGVWGSSGSDVFAVGTNGTILHYDGNAWSDMSWPTYSYLNGVWGSSGSDAFVVGGNGIILHYNGSVWESMSSGTTLGLEEVWGNSGCNVFAVGLVGTIVHYNGRVWTPMSSGTTERLWGVGGNSGRVFVVGNNKTILLHYADTVFADVLDNNWAYCYIIGIYDEGITTGYGDGRYGPDDFVTREQMTVFITRALNQVPEDGYCGSVAPFLDVPADRWSCKYVKMLVELGITSGIGGGLFGPEGVVTREQMAAFITRALDEVPLDGYCGTEDPFTDVPYSWWSCKYIKRLMELGITSGIGGGLYGPGNPVTRAQMAVFLARAFLGM